LWDPGAGQYFVILSGRHLGSSIKRFTATKANLLTMVTYKYWLLPWLVKRIESKKSGEKVPAGILCTTGICAPSFSFIIPIACCS
jgi:hypothetical protein